MTSTAKTIPEVQHTSPVDKPSARFEVWKLVLALGFDLIGQGRVFANRMCGLPDNATEIPRELEARYREALDFFYAQPETQTDKSKILTLLAALDAQIDQSGGDLALDFDEEAFNRYAGLEAFQHAEEWLTPTRSQKVISASRTTRLLRFRTMPRTGKRPERGRGGGRGACAPSDSDGSSDGDSDSDEVNSTLILRGRLSSRIFFVRAMVALSFLRRGRWCR